MHILDCLTEIARGALATHAAVVKFFLWRGLVQRAFASIFFALGMASEV
ncbi:hypothetical protein CPter91_2429 [Collimonas pratensis]|uniref:Uncharacterized protein n=1 Tax=Collimonas pratensis TaxID=279113 RepID=A0A127Q3Z2_9BURK|nr:hypothetical protein CPter91_2429 [Collimonas pratensis]